MDTQGYGRSNLTRVHARSQPLDPLVAAGRLALCQAPRTLLPVDGQMVTASITYGYSLYYIQLQFPLHMVTASITSGASAGR